MSKHSLFTSESVSIGHPDKVADQISDAILDECLRHDPMSKVACETLVSSGLVVLAGEITTRAHLDYQTIVRRVIQKIGYVDPAIGFDYRSCAVVSSINKQSLDIARGVSDESALGAGDQGMMFGYACDETDVYMPLPVTLSHCLMHEQKRLRESGELPYLRPDAKAQVTVEYDGDRNVAHVDTVVLSTQHTEEIEYDQLVADMMAMVRRVIPPHLLDKTTKFYINPTGRFVIGGPIADCGLTGRKIIVDTYGGVGRHGGGAFSGKDPTKVDRSGAYAARCVAKTIVAAGLARRCEVQLAYAIGVPHPVSIKVDTEGSGIVPESQIVAALPKVFDLSPKGIIDTFNLRRPIYEQVAYGGHFGRPELDLPWESLDKVSDLHAALEFEHKSTLKPAFVYTVCD